MLRPYQQDAVDAAVEHFETSLDPILLSLATGSGKSHILAELARMFGRALVLAPSRELVKQDFDKYQLVSPTATLFCAGLGEKDFTGEAVFGSPQSVRRSLDDLPFIDAVLVDEAHRGLAEYALIIEHIRQHNPNVKVVGVSATPYKLPGGYIYRLGPDGVAKTDDEAIEPYYARCVYEISARELIDNGWLTPPVLVPTGIEYDTSALQLSRGKYTAESLEETFCGRKNLTSRIVSDVVRRSANRNGVMIFASSVAHAREIVALLPRGHARIVTAETPSKEREHIVTAFKCALFKYLVNVSVLTTGFDAPHVDHIAILRVTESAALWQQIAGRGTRLFPGKENFLISEYAGGIERFFGDDRDLFDPVIRARKVSKHGEVDVECPSCQHVNRFAAVPNPNGLAINRMGNFVDLAGAEIRIDQRAIPAHHGRRCQHHYDEGGELLQCAHRWLGKKCKWCGHENDTAARQCEQCDHQLVDWNKQLEFVAGSRSFITDTHGWKKARCVNAKIGEWWSGNVRLYRVDLFIEGRKTPLSKFYQPNDPSYRTFLDRAAQGLPEFVLWKTVKNKRHPTTKLQWGPDETICTD